MLSLSRRAFLGASLAGIAGGRLLAADKPTEATPKATDDFAFQPTTLFLTWQRDPTTTMTVQWIGATGETAEHEGLLPCSEEAKTWANASDHRKPYPLTDFKVFRAELTGLTPGTDYQFRIGKQSPTYRFRTMPAKATDTIHFISGGDCGVNAHTVANNIQAARQDPMFAVIGGDLGYDNGTLGRVQPRVPAQLQQAHDRPRRPADPDDRRASATTKSTAATTSRATRRRSSTPSSTASIPTRATPRSTSAITSAWCCLTPATPTPSAATRPTGWRRRCKARDDHPQCDRGQSCARLPVVPQA